ncbi:MAG: histone deacetylase [Candidatus Altiarchaeota archaeon]|nr:histone deacetylase [Candidatus Altiarchaeota archaeon]
MRTGIVYDDRFLKHRQAEGHPEVPERLTVTMEYLHKTGLINQLEQIKPQPAALEDLLRVHSREHVEYIKRLSESGSGRFAVIDPDTYVCPETYETAVLAAGGVISAADAVMDGKLDNCYALIRPPGHHASKNQATGFCYFDNVAVAIRHVQAKYDVKKVLLFDWDAHAPNGAMGTFYDDNTVLNASIHQDPHNFYPGTGFVEQIGEGKGKGYTMNIPVPAGTGDADYVYALKEFLVPRIRKFKPEVIFISAGQDSHRDDLISGLKVTEAGYSHMTRIFMDLAAEFCGNRLVMELEGGYNLMALARSNNEILQTLLGVQPYLKIEGEVRQSTLDVLKSLEEVLKRSRIWTESPDL